MQQNKSIPTQCPKCSKNTLYANEGISAKTGKPYKNNKCASCQFLEWIPVGGTTPFVNRLPETPQTPSPASNTAIQALIVEVSALRGEVAEILRFLKENLGAD